MLQYSYYCVLLLLLLYCVVVFFTLSQVYKKKKKTICVICSKSYRCDDFKIIIKFIYKYFYCNFYLCFCVTSCHDASWRATNMATVIARSVVCHARHRFIYNLIGKRGNMLEDYDTAVSSCFTVNLSSLEIVI